MKDHCKEKNLMGFRCKADSILRLGLIVYFCLHSGVKWTMYLRLKHCKTLFIPADLDGIRFLLLRENITAP